MYKRIGLATIILIIMLSMGCTLRSPETNPSYSILPEVIIDYDFENELAKIWVKSAISDFKYSHIIIALESENLTIIMEDTYTYCVNNSIKADVFNLTVEVTHKENQFVYQASIKIEYIEDIFVLTIFDIKEDEEDIFYEDDLPYKKVLKESG